MIETYNFANKALFLTDVEIITDGDTGSTEYGAYKIILRTLTTKETPGGVICVISGCHDCGPDVEELV